MKLFRVSCVWQLYGHYEIEAEDEKEAKEIADDMALPDGEYVEDSFQVDEVAEIEPTKP